VSKNYRAELIGLFGDPVDDNPTGAMMEAAFEHDGLNYRYINMRVVKEDLPVAFAGVKAAGYVGCNFTMPHKIAILPLLDELSPAASIIGAVNTAVCREGRWLGDNTDGKGFVSSLIKSGTEIEGAKIVILGAGGAARAIAVECALAGAAEITVVNRTLSRAQELAEVINKNTPAVAVAVAWDKTYSIPSDVSILIQATSIGFAPNIEDYPDIDYSTVRSEMTVGDVVFCPLESVFIRRCKERGAKTIPGIDMLVEQGVLAYELWTNKTAPSDVMSDKLKAEMN